MFKDLKLKIGHSRKGVSLPLVTGLVTLLMVASLAANELIIRTIRSVRSVEASSRAYFAAEAGIEDGLYELTPHLAGYETPSLDTDDVRKDVFDKKGGLDKCSDIGKSIRWANCWDIESRGTEAKWSEKMFKDQKLVISLYRDGNNVTEGNNAINTTAIPPSEISNLRPSNFSIKFWIPTDEPAMAAMRIDNDQDGGTPNEDGPNDDDIECLKNPEDFDCDDKVDEDSAEDPVILWKLTDDNGRSLIPLKGCLEPKPNAISNETSEICERDFIVSNGNFTAKLDSDYYGLNELGQKETIRSFIETPNDITRRMQFEFLIVAPMEYVNQQSKKQPIQNISYEVDSGDGVTVIPYPYFNIRSDGYYGNYKQSITTRITPKTSVPLFDFTIIQQQ